MKKKLTFALCLILILLLLTGCASQDIAKARTAYANGDYETVVALLENLKTSKPEAAQLLNNAKAHLAFDAGDFQQVLDLLESGELADEEMAALLEAAQKALDEAAAEEEALAQKAALIAEAKAALEAGEFQKALDLIAADETAAADEELSALRDEAQDALEKAEADAAAAAEEAKKLAEEAKLAEEKALEEANIAAAVREEKLSNVKAALEAGEFQKALDLIAADESAAVDEEFSALRDEAQDALEKAEAEAVAAAEEAKLAEEKALKEAEAAAAAREEKLSEAKAALDAGEYQQVLDLVQSEDAADPDFATLVDSAKSAIAEAEAAVTAREEKLSEVKAALDAGEYQQVLDLVQSEDAADPDFATLVDSAKSAIAEAEAVAAREEKLVEVKSAIDSRDYQQAVSMISDEDAQDNAFATLLKEARIGLANQDGDYETVVALLADDADKTSNEVYLNAVRYLSETAILATGDQKYIQLPQDSSYLAVPKILYVDRLPYDWYTATLVKEKPELAGQQKTCGPCIPVERVPALRTGNLPMPWAYEGTKVTVLAEENNMSCILYLSSENVQRAGWVQSEFLADEFPGEVLTVGDAWSGAVSTIDDVNLRWARQSFLTSAQSYSDLTQPVENCVGFTLEYQIIKENTEIWSCIFGPRSVYVNNGSEWVKVGTFDYPQHGTVRVQVNLPEPMDIIAIGTIAEVGMPNTAFYRQNTTEFLIAD